MSSRSAVGAAAPITRAVPDTVHVMTRPDPAPSTSRPRAAAVGLLALEALTLLAIASLALLDGARSSGELRTFAMGIAAFLAVFAVLVGAAALSVLRERRFGIGFGITWQLFQALVGASLLRASLLAAGLFALVTAVLAFVLLFQLSRTTPTPLERD